MPSTEAALARKRREKVFLLARDAMKARFVVLRTLGRTNARSPEDLYGFRPQDVRELYVNKSGYGPGLWFRLNDGRVVDSTGRRSDRNRDRYVVKPLPRTPANRQVTAAPANSNTRPNARSSK